MELIIKVLENYIQKYCMNFAIGSVARALGREAAAI